MHECCIIYQPMRNTSKERKPQQNTCINNIICCKDDKRKSGDYRLVNEREKELIIFPEAPNHRLQELPNSRAPGTHYMQQAVNFEHLQNF